MSFHDKGFWIAKSSGTEGDTLFDNSSRIEPKRSHQWFADDAAEAELFPNKKQAVQVPNTKSPSSIPTVTTLPWENASTQFIDRLFGPETSGPVNFTDGTELDMRKKVTNDPFGPDSTFGLAVSYTIDDPGTCVSYGGIRKVKVNQVKDSENGIQPSKEHTTTNETSFISMGQAYGKEDESVTLMGHTYNRGATNICDDNPITIAHPCNKGDTSTMSFGGFQDEPVIDTLARPIGSYDLLYNQSTVQTLDASNASAIVAAPQLAKPRLESVPKSKSESKGARKEAPNSFPSNVRSLIATGMLDGVPIKYVSLSREELRGIIKGSGYLCGCQSCNYTKALNAYEFERHAGCKTKHPNNHIYFENGKTIYQIVQELRSTPESLLFDAIQTVTGSPINQKAFRIWKESFQAATRELQRIYGKEELNL
ncbi:hypothetical protein LguiB_031227 [Lonicera macranthoides]